MMDKLYLKVNDKLKRLKNGPLNELNQEFKNL